jgi:hypothetical protein
VKRALCGGGQTERPHPSPNPPPHPHHHAPHHMHPPTPAHVQDFVPGAGVSTEVTTTSVALDRHTNGTPALLTRDLLSSAGGVAASSRRCSFAICAGGTDNLQCIGWEAVRTVRRVRALEKRKGPAACTVGTRSRWREIRTRSWICGRWCWLCEEGGSYLEHAWAWW